MIQSCKYSFVSGQLYSLRAQVANSDDRLDVFGFGWDEPWLKTIPRLIVEFLRAVNELLHRGGFEIEALSLQPFGYHDIALRRLA